KGDRRWGGRHCRCFPGQGELPLEAFAEQIPRCGYGGPWSLEIFNDGFRASPNGATAKDGYRSLLWLEEQTRRRLPTCDADLFSPPPLPVYHGLEFIEFAASAAEAQRLGQHLQALGFQHEGSHRSRQVTLWRNGGARIVINHQPHSRSALAQSENPVRCEKTSAPPSRCGCVTHPAPPLLHSLTFVERGPSPCRKPSALLWCPRPCRPAAAAG
ncbi:hypothetical protein I8Q49_21175, partial [Acinetobacter baumannii]|nr:hypothetical protein [Acinetobacter baumannii]